MEYIFKNVRIVTLDEQNRVINNGWLAVENGVISAIGEGQPDFTAEQLNGCRVIDGTDKVIMPGLINAHTHIPMTLLRGYADDMPLHEWLFDRIFPAEAKLGDEQIELGSQIGCAELIAGGVTCFADMYKCMPVIARTAAECGIKANVSNGATCFCAEQYDFDADNVTREMKTVLERYHNFDNGRIRLDASIHAEYTSFDAVWQKNVEFAKEHGLGMHIHLSETKKEHDECVKKYGMTPARVFEKAGVFDVRTCAAHCVWITPEDMEILSEHGVSATHNPVSNLKLASGTAPVCAMLNAGINVALGTDGASSNNNLDMFEEIKTAAIVAKNREHDAQALPAETALRMATVYGARALGRQEQCGMLKTGLDADIIMLDFDRPHLLPLHNVISSLCYSAHASDVVMNMCRGKVLYAYGEYKTIDIEKVRYAAKRKF